MARTRVLKGQKRINVSIEQPIHLAAVDRVKTLRIPGGFSGYIASLIVSDLGHKRSVAERVSRHLPQKRKVA